MNTRRLKVIQWATGNTGKRALREVIRDPILELVGVRVYDDDKNGIDAGELCGEPATGILATTDRDAVLQLDADCCVYMPRATGRGATRSGLTEDELVDDIVALVSKGTNVVSTCTDLFYRGIRLSEENRDRLLRACESGNASIWTSGSDPDWDLQPTGWRLKIDGDAPIHMSAPFPVPLEELANYVPAFNANAQINAVPYVCDAKPGILTTLDLPHILPRCPGQ